MAHVIGLDDAFADFLTQMDDFTGRILAELDTLGLSDHTIRWRGP